MIRPRHTLVCASVTPYYHVIGRCVRRAHLCGNDTLTGKSFDHRRDWILSRLKTLTEIFAIDLCAYALMGNHYHLILRLTPESVKTWTPQEVVARWARLFAGPNLVQRYRDGAVLTESEAACVSDLIEDWRSRLTNLS